MNGDSSFYASDSGAETIVAVPALVGAPSSESATRPSLSDLRDDVAGDWQDALDDYLGAHGAEIEDNGDRTVTVTGAPRPEQREWLLTRYAESGPSCDGRGVIWHDTEVPDA
jgi:hypothetical protein